MANVRDRGHAFEAAPATARAKLFAHGGSQAVRLPKAFRFDGAEVSIRRSGDAVILEPVRVNVPRTREEMAAFWARIDALRGDDLLVTPPDPPFADRDFDH